MYQGWALPPLILTRSCTLSFRVRASIIEIVPSPLLETKTRSPSALTTTSAGFLPTGIVMIGFGPPTALGSMAVTVSDCILANQPRLGSRYSGVTAAPGIHSEPVLGSAPGLY